MEYKVGARTKKQRWFYETPEAIRVDERKEKRETPKIERLACRHMALYRT